MGTLINPNTFKEAVQTVSGMSGRDGAIKGMNYLDIEALGIQLYALHEYEIAMESLRQGNISKAMFEISQQ